MQLEYQIINSKPYLGDFFSRYVIVSLWQDENISEAKKITAPSTINGLEVRHIQCITRPPPEEEPLQIKGTIGFKWMYWGRAFMVKRLSRKGSKRFKKVWLNGQRRKVIKKFSGQAFVEKRS